VQKRFVPWVQIPLFLRILKLVYIKQINANLTPNSFFIIKLKLYVVHFVNFSVFFWLGDCSTMYQLRFQDPATTTMEGIYLFNIHLLFIIASIVLLVAWLLVIVLRNFTEVINSQSTHFSHSNIIEIIWTSVPAIILLSLASPSFSLLFSLDEICNPELTLKILGHQWY
jgi:heme/copper-type cytochrome/quinol oxidase subunit 2